MLEREARLDSPVLSGRLRKTARRSDYERRAVNFTRSAVISDIRRPASVKIGNLPPKPHGAPPVMPGPVIVSDVSPHPRLTLPNLNKMSGDIRKVSRKSSLSSSNHHIRTTSSTVLKRQIVEAPHAQKARRKGSKSKRRIRMNAQNLLTLAAVVVILGGLGIGLQGFWANKEVATKAATLGSTTAATNEGQTASDVPSETQVADPSTYKVAADRPRVITIDKIKVNARVVKLGIKANNQLAAPSNIFDAGWYDESSKPGEGGAVVIDGHVSGPTKHGVFYDLKKLVAGDQIKVERGDGKIFTYKVVKSVTSAADKVDMAAVLTPVTKGRPGLNLITCSGEIDASRNHYKDRTVVFAEQM